MAFFVAPAMAGTKTYAGKTDGGGFVGADVVIKDGKPKMIKAGSRVKNLPGECELSGEQRLDAATPEDIKVKKNGGFDYTYVQPVYGNKTTISGRFEGKTVTGVIDLDLHFSADGDLPEEDCKTGVLTFEATKGAKDQTQ
jgi:hypothetical protein